ncbi:MAG TPA: DUF4097 family beta strand repeat-containing protein [Actinocrinis sp.]|uniref:DUF4097 family beta strand repeat-containing protein n=1 Tax=Actinocrinis sp. TaxID=1920516 RepID=UPI002DDD0996|nr:DUF4097 family beta strand repeat-containing protein [Actinocrinis sp.]HEV2343470.1 DUF4097 family beta strand repeat-containing protein [Actinocrinis sp.]
MTRRELTCPETGPIVLDARSLAACIRVSVADTDHAHVTISTPDTAGASHDAVTTARLEHTAGRLTVRLDDQGAAISRVTIVRSGNRVSMTTLTADRDLCIVGGRVIIDGVEITPGTATVVGTSPVTIDAVLPPGSLVHLTTQSGDITLHGAYPEVRAQSVSGDITAERADHASVQTTSGDIRITTAGHAVTNTVSGDTDIDRTDTLTANSVSGDIHVREAADLVSAATASGDITVHHTGPVPITRTVTGRVRTTANTR